MKKFGRFMGLFAALALLLVTMTACGSSKALSKQDVLKVDTKANTITWGVKADTKLFGLMNTKTSIDEGFEVDVAKALTKEILGKDGKAVFVPITSSTRVPLLRNGNIDAIIATMTITPEREKQVDFTRSYFNAGQAILVKKGSPIQSVKDLNKKGKVVIGVVASHTVQNIGKFAPKAKVLQMSDYAQALTALKSGQGDALTTDNGILYGMSVDNPGYVVVGGSFTQEPYGIAVNQGQTNFKNRLNKALTTIENDGTYNKILKKWFGNVEGFNYEEMKR